MGAQGEMLALGKFKVTFECAGYIKGHDDSFIGVGCDAFDAQGVEMGAHV